MILISAFSLTVRRIVMNELKLEPSALGVYEAAGTCEESCVWAMAKDARILIAAHRAAGDGCWVAVVLLDGALYRSEECRTESLTRRYLETLREALLAVGWADLTGCEAASHYLAAVAQFSKARRLPIGSPQSFAR